ncbi:MULTISPECIES: YbaB/EbfC family nucleoid-associated protein [unclassified Micromonospora]|uniref:YbaB/EbfC family nucleoid-associated protein n=1 Tax=unclassified Micromonospora TaxID=2617518 RepID=UPI002E2180A7|nr:YbaB/EbfC family nucleoid-associated protein [Micromonospora sp. NBC_00858]
MSDVYRRAVESVREVSRTEAYEPAMRRAEAATRDLVALVTETGDRTHEGFDETGTITAVVDGAGQLTDVRISARAVRDLPAELLGPHCRQAVTAARLAMAESMRASLDDVVEAPVEWDGRTEDPLAVWRDATRRFQ